MQRCLILAVTLAVSHFSCIAYSQQGRAANLPESRQQWRIIYVGGANQ